MIDILYLTWNRREFTRFSLRMLIQNTDWSLVNRLVIHDDGSDVAEGTVGVIRSAAAELRARGVNVFEYERSWQLRFGSPPAVMNWFLDGYAESDRFVKLDSDIVVPPGWLEALIGVMDRSPELDLLGFEAGRMGPPGHNGAPWDWERPVDGYSWEPCSHIGGVGMMRVRAFEKHPALEEGQGRFGFTAWQHEYEPVRGWITPDLLVAELSRVPLEPWIRLAAEYADRDWERPWPKYHPRWDYWWSWW